MKRLFRAPVVLFTLALLASACAGSSNNESAPNTVTGPSPAPSPSPSPNPSPSPSPSPAPGCNASVSGVPTSIPGAGGRYQVSIGVSSSCQWTARTDVNWADIAPGSGQGNAAPMLQVNRNEAFF